MPFNIQELVRPATGRWRADPRWWARAAVLAVLYSLAYLLLDRLDTFDFVKGVEISPWEPVIPFLIAAVFEFGLPIIPLTILLPWLAVVVNEGADPLGFLALSALVCIGGVYTGTGLLLRRALRNRAVNSISGFARLMITLAAGALLCAALLALAQVHAGKISLDALPSALVTEWIDDLSIAVVMLPLYLLWRTREGLQLRQLRPRLGELFLLLLTLVVVFSVTFGLLAPVDLQLFYLFFIPVAWTALRFGEGITSIAVVALQLGIVLVLADRGAAQAVVEIQLLLLVLAGTGLFMGIAVSNNNRLARLVVTRDEQLAWVNRSTGIMELNTAIAHELNNPLAAVSNYLRAATLLLERPEVDQQRVQDTVHKALGEANRAVEVLGELRAFYRSGAVNREPLEPRRLIDDSVAVLQTKLQQWGIKCTVNGPADIPRIEADATQLSVVLHNLLGNACDAVKDMDAGRKSVALRVEHVGDEVRFSIEDRGRGIPPAIQPQLFWPLNSAKPSGMGLGLAISRSLVEANGGRIWLERSDANGTCIAFSIPVWQGAGSEQMA